MLNIAAINPRASVQVITLSGGWLFTKYSSLKSFYPRFQRDDVSFPGISNKITTTKIMQKKRYQKCFNDFRVVW